MPRLEAVCSRLGAVVSASVLAAMAGAVALSLGVGADSGNSQTPADALTPAPAVSLAPGSLVGTEFPVLALVGLDGRPLATRDADGRPVVLIVWKTGCDCAEAFETANTIFVEDGAEVSVVGISFDTDLAQAAKTAFAEGLLFPSALDRGGVVAARVGDAGLPIVLVIDSNGTVVAEFTGPITVADVTEALP